MAKTRVVLEIDNDKAWDAVQSLDGDMSAIGQRFANPMLTGQDVDFVDAVGLAFYGITVVDVSRMAEEASPSTQEAASGVGRPEPA